MLIYLTGFMGAGKTTVGKKLASHLKYNFIDLDQQVEKETGKSIALLFEEGENRFRETETHILKKTLNIENTVVATGGGTPCFNDNMNWMNDNGFTVYLKLTTGSLFHRLAESKQNRPLLDGKSDVALMEFIIQALQERERFYNMSKLIFKGENADMVQLWKEINQKSVS
jgi:shikimate kinase